MNSPKQFRTNIDATLEHGEWFKAHAALGDLWRLDPKATTAAYVVSCYDRLRGRIPMAPCKISFLRSMTVEPLVPMLRSTASVAGIDLTVQVGQFNAYVQEILDPASSVYSFEPNVVILAMQTRDILPEIWEAYSDLTQAEVTAAIDKTVKEISGWVRTFRLRSKASLIIHSFEKPTASAGILESQINYGQMAAVDRLNNELRDICGQHRGVYVLDYDGVIARHGRTRWYDEQNG